SRRARLRRSDSRARGAKTVVATGDRAWLSRPHVWISSRRARAPNRRKDAVRLLAGKFCETAQSRFLDRPPGKRKFACGNDVRCEERQASRTKTILCRS